MGNKNKILQYMPYYSYYSICIIYIWILQLRSRF